MSKRSNSSPKFITALLAELKAFSLLLPRHQPALPPMTAAAAALPCFACLSSCSVSQKKFAHPNSDRGEGWFVERRRRARRTFYNYDDVLAAHLHIPGDRSGEGRETCRHKIKSMFYAQFRRASEHAAYLLPRSATCSCGIFDEERCDVSKIGRVKPPHCFGHSVFSRRVYPVLPHNRENILFSFRLNPCVFVQSVESGKTSEGGGRSERIGRERLGESYNTTTWNLVMYASPLLSVANSCNRITRQKRDSCGVKTLPVPGPLCALVALPYLANRAGRMAISYSPLPSGSPPRQPHFLMDSAMSFLLPDVLEQPHDEQGLRPQDTGGHQVASRRANHALRPVFGDQAASTATR